METSECMCIYIWLYFLVVERSWSPSATRETWRTVARARRAIRSRWHAPGARYAAGGARWPAMRSRWRTVARDAQPVARARRASLSARSLRVFVCVVGYFCTRIDTLRGGVCVGIIPYQNRVLRHRYHVINQSSKRPQVRGAHESAEVH